MTEPNRYAVPVDQLDDVRVAAAEQVEVERVLPAAGGGSWTGELGPAFGDGASADADGE